MTSRRSGVGVIAYNGAIYAVGGFDGVSRTSTAERYSPTDRTWSNLPDMYNARSNFGIEVIDDMLFVIGGFNGETTIYNVECYDTQAGEWYNATDMNLYKSALSACVVRDLPDVRDYVYKKGENCAQQQHMAVQTAVTTSSARTATTNTSPVNTSPAGVVAGYVINRFGARVSFFLGSFLATLGMFLGNVRSASLVNSLS
ncbi:kelch-like protein 10 [Elysia marginata]|uniref:Kelch-like protein 10 n=1 Tax=Elysia marginata TaxID=1093978 RepID=A0AAV4JV45_9GAST|nr:kelch-like protein 10 [Elysia marginata]